MGIGTELLMGELTDTNSSWIASRLPALGIELQWVSIIGDDLPRLDVAGYDGPGTDQRAEPSDMLHGPRVPACHRSGTQKAIPPASRRSRPRDEKGTQSCQRSRSFRDDYPCSRWIIGPVDSRLAVQHYSYMWWQSNPGICKNS